MKKPDNLKNYSHDVFRGFEMKTEGDTTWNFSKDFDIKIENDAYYKVWYHYHDAADPADTSTSYYVVYAEKIPSSIMKLKKAFEDFLEN